MAEQPEDSRERRVSGSDRTLGNDQENQTASPEREDGGEKGEEGKPKPVGFWHESLNKSRRKVFAGWAVLSRSEKFLVLTSY